MQDPDVYQPSEETFRIHASRSMKIQEIERLSDESDYPKSQMQSAIDRAGDSEGMSVDELMLGAKL